MDSEQLKNKLKILGKQVVDLSPKITNEEQTKNAFIMPFFQILGWNIFNPLEFIPEFTADVGTKKGEKVDYAIAIDGAVQVLIECKSIGENLDKHDSQLFRYFATQNVKFGILTNGREYRFFTDLEKTNVMDEIPFLVFDITKIPENKFVEIAKFCKENFNVDDIMSSASDLKYANSFKEFIAKNMTAPTDSFTKYVLGEIYEGRATAKIIEQFKPIIADGFSRIITETANEKIENLSKNLDSASKIEEKSAEKIDEKVAPKAITTRDELEIYSIVKFLLKDFIDVSRIFYRDTKSNYFNIILDDKITKWILRYWVYPTHKTLEIRDYGTFEIDSTLDVANFIDKIKETVKKYS